MPPYAKPVTCRNCGDIFWVKETKNADYCCYCGAYI